MPAASTKMRQGIVWRSRETSLYFSMLTSAELLDQKCSARKAPTGNMPVKECSLRQKKLWSAGVSASDMPSPKTGSNRKFSIEIPAGCLKSAANTGTGNLARPTRKPPGCPLGLACIFQRKRLTPPSVLVIFTHANFFVASPTTEAPPTGTAHGVCREENLP